MKDIQLTLVYVEQFTSPGPPASLELVELVMQEHGLQIPHSMGEAVVFYLNLIDALEDMCHY